MNLEKLRETMGRRLRLRPQPTAWRGTTYEPVDDSWLLLDVRGHAITLENERTRQRVSLSPDHVHSYTSSSPEDETFQGFLELKVKIDITPPEPTLDIILSGAARTIDQPRTPPLRARVVELLRTINPEILSRFEAGSSQVAVMISDVNLRALRALENEDGFSDLLSLQSTGSMSLGVGSRVGGHIPDRNDTGACHGFVLRLGRS